MTVEQRARDGEPASEAADAILARYYEAHWGLVVRVCRRFSGGLVDAEDAAQETFLAAQRALRSGASPREPAAWLAAIARHVCWQRAQRRIREPLQFEELREDASVSADAFEVTAQRSDQALLWKAVSELPGQQQRAFLLSEIAGHSNTHAAESLGVSVSAVESLLVRARRRLRTRLRPVLRGAVWLPFSLRSLVEQLELGSGGAAAATAAKVASLPVAAKIAAAGASVALVAGGSFVATTELQKPSKHPTRAAPMHVPTGGQSRPVRQRSSGSRQQGPAQLGQHGGQQGGIAAQRRGRAELGQQGRQQGGVGGQQHSAGRQQQRGGTLGLQVDQQAARQGSAQSADQSGADQPQGVADQGTNQSGAAGNGANP